MIQPPFPSTIGAQPRHVALLTTRTVVRNNQDGLMGSRAWTGRCLRKEGAYFWALSMSILIHEFWRPCPKGQCGGTRSEGLPDSHQGELIHGLGGGREGLCGNVVLKLQMHSPAGVDAYNCNHRIPYAIRQGG